ncbi:MAG: MFS transporter [Myxococcota bacterium]
MTAANNSSAGVLKQTLDTFKATAKLGRTFWVCNAIYMLDGAAYFGILNILTLFLGQSVGMSDRWSGLSVSYFTGLVTFFSATLGGVADRLGVRRTITITILLALVGRAVLTLAPSLPAGNVISWVGLTLMAVSAGALQPAVYAGVKQATNKETSAIGFSLLYALMNGGIVLEAFASSLVRERWQTTGVFWMCTGITLLYLLVHLTLFPSSAGAPVPAAPPQPGEKRSLRDHALFNPRFLFFIFVLLGVRTLFAHQWLTMPDYVTRAYPQEVGARFEWINGLNPLIILFGTPLVAAVTRHVNVVTMMVVGTAVSAGATFLLVPGPDLTALLAYVIIFSIGEAMWSSRFLEYVAEIAPPDKVGVYMGVAQIPWFVAKFTTGLYSGFMLESFCPAEGAKNTGTMWLIYALVGISSPVGLMLGRKWLLRGSLAHKGETQAAAA